MPFDVFHEAVEKSLGRPVFTHEFGLNRDGMMKELCGDEPPPTFKDIINIFENMLLQSHTIEMIIWYRWITICEK